MHLTPPTEEVRHSLLAQLQRHLDIVMALPRIQSSRYQVGVEVSKSRSEATYRSILTRLGEGYTELVSAYAAVERRYAAVHRYVHAWMQYQALWDMQTDAIVAGLGDEMEKWKDLLVEIRQARRTFDTSESSKSFGPVEVDFSQVQARVKRKYDALYNGILNKFGEKIGTPTSPCPVAGCS